jgi:hypothetical protein
VATFVLNHPEAIEQIVAVENENLAADAEDEAMVAQVNNVMVRSLLTLCYMTR